MDIRDMAVWLIKEASDEEFAEFFVLYNKIFRTGNPNVILTKEDMVNADINSIMKCIKDSVDEILFSEEVDTWAWWKQKGE